MGKLGYDDPYAEVARLEDELEAAVDEVKKYTGHHPGLSLAENVHEMVKDLAHEREEVERLTGELAPAYASVMTLLAENKELKVEVERLREVAFIAKRDEAIISELAAERIGRGHSMPWLSGEFVRQRENARLEKLL